MLSRLRVVGLSARTAYTLMRFASPLLRTCYTDEQVFDFLLEYSCDNHPETKSPTSQYALQLRQQSTWVRHRTFGAVCNYASEMTSSAIEAVASGVPLQTSNATLYFHATSWHAAPRIATRGPRSDIGRSCLDFGCTSSFYITASVADALDWGKRQIHGEACLMVFEIPDGLLDDGLPGLTIKVFRDATDDWAQLVTMSRRDKDNELDNYDFVYGPMAANAWQVKKQAAKAHDPPKFQLAAKTTGALAFLKSHYLGGMWLNKRDIRARVGRTDTRRCS